MLFSTPTQFAVLALCLIAGWLFGLASHPGGRKWKERYRSEEAAHKATREEIATRDARLRELERDHDHRSTMAPAVATGAAVAAAPAAKRGGLFGGGKDDLSRIRGIDEPTERALHGEGIKTFAAIEALSPSEENALEERLNMGRGRIAQQQWRDQAAVLRDGDDTEHQRRWG